MLDENQKKVADIIAGYLRKRVGQRLAETQSQICEFLSQRDIEVSASEFRELINYLRNTLKEPILSTNKGYYYPSSKEDLVAFTERLWHRIESQTVTYNSLKNIEWNSNQPVK